jgi:hypothetical protein
MTGKELVREAAITAAEAMKAAGCTIQDDAFAGFGGDAEVITLDGGGHIMYWQAGQQMNDSDQQLSAVASEPMAQFAAMIDGNSILFEVSSGI